MEDLENKVVIVTGSTDGLGNINSMLSNSILA